MTAQWHSHPLNSTERVFGVTLVDGDTVTRECVFASPKGHWSPVQSGAIGLRLTKTSSFVRPVRTITVEEPTPGELQALAVAMFDVGPVVSGLLTSLLVKLQVSQ